MNRMNEGLLEFIKHSLHLRWTISMLKPFLQTLASTHEREKGEELELHALQV